MVGLRGDPVGRRLDDLDRARLRIRALGLRHHGAHAIPRQRAGDEDHVAVEARDAVPAVRERVDGELELGAVGGTGGGLGGGHHSRVRT
jgi:hypothetical protein